MKLNQYVLFLKEGEYKLGKISMMNEKGIIANIIDINNQKIMSGFKKGSFSFFNNHVNLNEDDSFILFNNIKEIQEFIKNNDYNQSLNKINNFLYVL